MKILRNVILFALTISIANAMYFTDSVKIAENNIIDNKPESAVEATLKLPKAKRLSYATIIVFGKRLNPTGTPPSLTIAIDGVECASRTLKHVEGAFGATIFVTKDIRPLLKAGKESMNVKVYLKGQNQTPCKINEIACRMLADERHFRTSSYIRPIFSGDEMIAESVFPLGNQDPTKPATAKLLFKPTSIIEAYTITDGKRVDLTQNKDFKIEGDTIEFLPNSNVKIIPYNTLFADTKEQANKLGNNFFYPLIKQFAVFKEGNWFHTRMVYISYKHRSINEKIGEKFDENLLPNTMKLIAAKKKLTVVLYGDSISEGANASGLSNTIPYAPTWGDYIATELQKYYKMPISFYNRALGGTDSNWGAAHVKTLVCPDKPDLAIIAFGMNDGCPKEIYRKNIEKIITEIRNTNPTAEIILVPSMTANPSWGRNALHDEYAKVLSSMQTRGIAIADVRSVHKRLQKQKRFIDMTGNNVNHPNDFLIRVYAQTILQKLIPSMSK